MPFRPAKIDRSEFYFLDDFGGGTWDNRVWSSVVVGAGSVSKIIAVGGQIQVLAAGTAGQNTQLIQGNRYNFDPANLTMRFRARVPDRTSAYIAVSAVDSALTSYVAWVANSAYLTPNWWALCRAGGGSSTLLDSGVAVDSNWHELAIITKPNSAEFLIDGALAVSTVSNVPTANLQLRGYAHIYTTASRSLLLDWIEAYGRRE